MTSAAGHECIQALGARGRTRPIPPPSHNGYSWHEGDSAEPPEIGDLRLCDQFWTRAEEASQPTLVSTTAPLHCGDAGSCGVWLLVDFIDAIAKHGPGKRRFFRFEYHDRAYYCDGKYWDGDFYCAVGVGPPVQVHTVSERIARVAAVDGDVGVVENVAADAMQTQEPDLDSGGPMQSEAERLMYRAYRCSHEVRCVIHVEENLEVQYPY